MKKATIFLFLIIFSATLFSQPIGLFTPNGDLYESFTNNIGINEDKPAAALHIRESEHQATAFRIDIASDPMSGPPGQNNFTEPEFAFKVNRKRIEGGLMYIDNLASIDGSA